MADQLMVTIILLKETIKTNGCPRTQCILLLYNLSQSQPLIKSEVSRFLFLCPGCNICIAALQYNPGCWFELQTEVSQLICPILTILTILTTQTIQTPYNMMHYTLCGGRFMI